MAKPDFWNLITRNVEKQSSPPRFIGTNSVASSDSVQTTAQDNKSVRKLKRFSILNPGTNHLSKKGAMVKRFSSCKRRKVVWISPRKRRKIVAIFGNLREGRKLKMISFWGRKLLINPDTMPDEKDHSRST